jgi:membrane protease subunit (stomatin/prohibitin family)
MALFSRENIAMPDSVKGQLIYKWPDMHIRRYSHCIVEGDYQALFTLQGEIKGVIDQPGRWGLEATELPFIGIFQDNLISGDGRYRSELYYVSKRDLPDKFGGPLTNIQDPLSQEFVKVFVYGEYMVKIVDPQALIYKLVGTVDVPDNSTVTDQTDAFLLQALSQLIAKKVGSGEWKLLGIEAYTDEITAAVLEKANQSANDYGLHYTKLPQFNINVDPEAEQNLRELYKKQANINLFGNVDPAAAARAAQYEMAIGASQGLAQGGAANTTAFLGMGMGMGQQFAGAIPGPPQAPAPAAPAPAPAAPQVPCPSCGTGNIQGAKFCANCGSSMAPPTAACPSCGAANTMTAKFCADCGTSMAPPPAAPAATCPGCGTELAPGAKFCPSCGRQIGG